MRLTMIGVALTVTSSAVPWLASYISAGNVQLFAFLAGFACIVAGMTGLLIIPAKKGYGFRARMRTVLRNRTDPPR